MKILVLSDTNWGGTSTKELYANSINSIAGIKDENVLNTYNIPSHITEIKTGAFSNQNNVNLKIYSENINLIGNNPVTSNSTIEFVNETKKEISEILSYSKEEINIKANDKILKLLGLDLKDQEGQKIAEVKLDESSYGNVINIGEKFTLINQKVVDNNFDVLKEDIQNEIISINDNFNNLLAWEKEFYINPDTNLGNKYNNYYSEYQKFYNQTDKLTEQTGTYTRYLMYKDSSLRLIQTFKNISINYDSTSKSLDLLEKLNINNINNNLPFEVVSTYNNCTTVPFNYLFNVSSTGTAFALNDNIIYTTLNGGNSKFTIYTKVNNNNDIFEFTLTNPNSIEGIEFVSAMKFITPETNYSTHTPIYGKTNILIGFSISGHLDEIMLDEVLNEVKSAILIKNNLNSNVTSKFNNFRVQTLNHSENNYNYCLSFDFISDINDNYYILEVSLGNGAAELAFRVDLKSKNITNSTELKATHSVKNNINSASLTNDIVFAESGIEDGYYIENNRLVYKTSANANNYAIGVKEGFTLNGNGYKVDVSKDTTSVEADARLVTLSGGKLNNLHIKLGIGTTYSRSGALNIAGAAVKIEGGKLSTIENCFIDGGLQGVRVTTNVTINNSTFKNNIVGIEIWQGASNNYYNVNINNVKIDARIDRQSSEHNASTHTVGIVYFPGSKGKGINNFHNITLSLNNYLYNGWINKDEAHNLVNTLIKGASLGFASISKDEIIGAFKDNNTIQNGDLVNMGILLPTKLNALFGTINGKLDGKWSDNQNILNSSYGIIHEASKGTMATVRLFMLNTVDNETEIAKTFDKTSGKVISLNHHEFIYS